MVVRVKHAFTAPNADGADPTKVRASNWNADLTLTYGPAFSASRTTNQNLISGTAAEIVFPTEAFDTDGAHSTSTGRFTPQVAGYYRFGAIVQGSNNGGATLSSGSLSIYKNGTFYQQLDGLPGSANACVFKGSVLVPLNGSTDYVSLFIQLSNTGAGPAVTNAVWDGNFVRGL